MTDEPFCNSCCHRTSRAVSKCQMRSLSSVLGRMGNTDGDTFKMGSKQMITYIQMCDNNVFACLLKWICSHMNLICDVNGDIMIRIIVERPSP